MTRVGILVSMIATVAPANMPTSARAQDGQTTKAGSAVMAMHQVPAAATQLLADESHAKPDTNAQWIIIGVGSAIGASGIASGIALAAVGGSADQRVGIASIAGGVAAVAVSVVIGILAR